MESLPLREDHLRRVQAEAERLLGSLEPLTAEFHRRLVEACPPIGAALGEGVGGHYAAFEAAVAIAFRNLDAIDALEGPLHLLGLEHARHGIGPALLRLAREVLLETIRHCAGMPWTREHEAAWRDALAALFAPIEQGAHAGLQGDAATR
jgi:hemoglobin-like flavoprotein